MVGIYWELEEKLLRGLIVVVLIFHSFIHPSDSNCLQKLSYGHTQSEV